VSRALAVAMVLLFVLAIGVTGARAEAEPPTGFQDTVVFENLQEPTVFRFAPDGRVFVAEKNGKILVFENLEDTTPTVFANLSKQVFDFGDKGILGLALDPKFDEGRPYVYALYTYDHELGETPAEGEPGWAPRWGKGPTWEGDECPEELDACVVSGRLVRLTAEGGPPGHAAPSAAEPDEDVLLEDWCQQFSSHSIGDLEFGPEGALFVSGGEGASFTVTDDGWEFGNPCGDPLGTKRDQAEGGSLRSQDVLTPADPTGLDGAVLRVNAENGEAWPGNPLSSSPDANARKIIAFGFRNPFRFTIDRRHDEIYLGNVGNGTDEEIDRFPLDPATPYNSGWPCYEGLGPEPGFESFGNNLCERLYKEPGSTSPPFFYFAHGAPIVPTDTCPTNVGSAISGSAFYEGGTYPAKYENALFFADAVRGCVYVMLADADGEPDPLQVEPFLAEEGVYPAVDIEQGPEGDLFYASLYGGPDEGSIHRISYDPDAPHARLSVDQAWGSKTKTFEFDASASTGLEGHALKYEWDLDGNGTYEKTGAATQSKSYGVAEDFRVAVRVTDEVSGKKSVAKLTVYPGDSPPQVNIAEPETSETWAVGQKIYFAGNGVEKEGTGSSVAPEDLYWKVRLLHCPFEAGACHEHPLQVFPGTEGGEFLAPDHDYPSALKVYLTATDKRGLTATRVVEVKARPVTLGFKSSPPGVTLTSGLKIGPAPFEMQAIEKSPTTISAPATATIGGAEYAFERWSDGGERVHTVVAASGGHYEAIYRRLEPPPVEPPPPVPSPPSPPQTTLLGHPPKHGASTTATFRFSADLAGASFQCALDGGPYKTCHSPRVYRNLKPGGHSLRLRALTADGGPDPTPIEFRWSVTQRRSGCAKQAAAACHRDR